MEFVVGVNGISVKHGAREFSTGMLQVCELKF